ncbi:MAG: hypothetical protein WAM60_09770 [Candidatus Promineifilaceae bacterium]
MKSDPNLRRLKVALATGGVIATLIGAGMLGKEASALAADSSTTTTITEPAVNGTSIDSAVPDELDLNLEAIPTVAAPTFRSAPVTFGRSSG